MSLANKYRPKTFEDVTEQKIIVDMLKSLCTSDKLSCRNFLLIGPAGCGKALCNDEVVLTVDGWKSVKHVKLGDTLFTRRGRNTNVIGVYPQGQKHCYRLNFRCDNGELNSIKVSEDHLNCVYLTNKKWYVPEISTSDIKLLFELGVPIYVDSVKNYECDEDYKYSMKTYYAFEFAVSSFDLNTKYRKLEGIEYIGEKDCTCFYVDDPDHTFLAGDMIPTHNTTLGRIMANVLNNNQGEPIELDAASHGSIEEVRNLIEQAKQYPIGQKYKVIIADECFHENTNIRTPEGLKRIADIEEGDSVYTMTGSTTVSKVFRNTVSVDNLVLMHLTSGQTILTTKDHLFFTDDGWVEARKLVNGDYLYDYQTMCDLRKELSNVSLRSEEDMFQGVHDSVSSSTDKESSCLHRLQQNVSNMWKELLHSEEHRRNNVFKQVLSYLQEASIRFSMEQKLVIFAQAGLYLSNLQKSYENCDERSTNILFERVCLSSKENLQRSASEDLSYKILCDMWQFLHPEVSWNVNMLSSLCRQAIGNETEGKKKSQIIYTDEAKQSYAYAGCEREDVQNESVKRYFASSACDTWGKWNLYTAADSVERSIEQPLEIRVSCKDTHRCKEQHQPLSCCVQTRPSVSQFTSGDRGGWCRPQYEISTIIRCQESKMSRKFRVEGVESYQPGCNDESFERYFTHKQLHSEFVTLYDLEVDGHPSYFAEDVLVHNCHSFSNTAWQSLLKTLEEGAGKAIWVLCTTNPEKIPATILSRVQTFQLSKISLEGIQNRLRYVIDCENKDGSGITYEDDAINYIAKLANGGMRDSLTLLDKALAYSKNLSSSTITQALNLPEYDDFFKLLQSYAKKDNVAIAKIVDEVYNSGVNFVKWMESFHSFVMQVVKYILLQDINKTMIPTIYRDKIAKYSSKHLIICLNLANKLLKMNQELKTTQYLQEVTLTHLCFLPKKEG